MTIRSDFQRYYSDGLMEVFKDIPFVPELNVGRCRIDLGTQDGVYGIEIKSSVSDLKSGNGLNQENFEYGYVACPRNILCQTIGYLYLCGMEHSGVLMVEKNCVAMIKPAVWNSEKCRENPLPVMKRFINCDEIARILYDAYKDGNEKVEPT